MKYENQVQFTFLSKSVNEGFARSAVACFAAQLDPTMDELGDIKTAVSEAVTNCIVHAYPDRIGLITLRCRILEDHTLDIVIKDKGLGILITDHNPKATLSITDRAYVIFDGKIGSLKRFTDDVKEVVAGYECGLSVEKYQDIKENDVLEIYEVVEEKRTLEDVAKSEAAAEKAKQDAAKDR